MEQFKRFVSSRKTLVWTNVILLLYELFFTLSILGCISGLETHFGGGLGDLLFIFVMYGVLIAHVIGLFVCVVWNAKAYWFAILLAIFLLPLTILHVEALRGNSKGYSNFGNYHGLYYDRQSIQ